MSTGADAMESEESSSTLLPMFGRSCNEPTTGGRRRADLDSAVLRKQQSPHDFGCPDLKAVSPQIGAP